MKVSFEFISFLAANDSATFLKNSLLDWKNNRIEFVEQSDIGLNDIFLISRMRKKTFMRFIKDYTTDITVVYSIMEELDDFFYTFDQETTKTYIELIQEKLAENKYFRENLVETSPEFYYLFDAVHDKQIHTTDKLFRYLGYPYEVFAGNDRFFKTFIHPEDGIRNIKLYNWNVPMKVYSNSRIYSVTI